MNTKELRQLEEEELKEILDIYYDFAPGTENCPVKPWGKWDRVGMWATIIGTIILWIVCATVIFPAYFS